MQKQNLESLQFENNVQKILDYLFKNKLNGKGFAIRLIALLSLGFIISGIAASITSAGLNNMMYSNYSTQNSIMSFSYIITSALSILAIVSFILTTSLSIRRVRDIVQDADIWPYVLVVILMSLIPFISYLVYLLLAFLPSNYLTQEKRNQLFSTFA